MGSLGDSSKSTGRFIMSIPSRSDKVAAVMCLPENAGLVVLDPVMLLVSWWNCCPLLERVKLLALVVHEEGNISVTSSSASTLIRRCSRLLLPPLPVLLVRGDELETSLMITYIVHPKQCAVSPLTQKLLNSVSHWLEILWDKMFLHCYCSRFIFWDTVPCWLVNGYHIPNDCSASNFTVNTVQSTSQKMLDFWQFCLLLWKTWILLSAQTKKWNISMFYLVPLSKFWNRITLGHSCFLHLLCNSSFTGMLTYKAVMCVEEKTKKTIKKQKTVT